MQRIMITGQPGSGKSTLARILGARLDIPVFHIDHIHHQAGWVPRTMPEKIVLCRAITDQHAWVFEGGLSATYPERLRRADTMIWLDIPLGLRFWRVIKRLVKHYGQTRPDLPDGCPERLSGETFAFWKWIWDTRNTARQKLADMAANPNGTTVIHLRSVKEVNAWLATLPPAPYLSAKEIGEADARPTGDRRSE